MQYEKAEAFVVEFEGEDILTASEGCDQPQYDAEYCDGQTQVVSKQGF